MITKNEGKNKKLKAVIGMPTNKGRMALFVPDRFDPSKCAYINLKDGSVGTIDNSLENILELVKERTPVYEGESVTIQF